MNTIPLQSANRRSGFTLVEMLVVITIIGILAALLIPAVFSAIRSAKTAALRMEVETLSQSIEGYQQKYGDYPPDFSDWELAKRHFRRIFPRMNNNELIHLGDASKNGTLIDAAEALVFALGGFSSDPEFPFTGSGGPLVVFRDNNGNVNYGYNSDRLNKLFDFKSSSLGLTQTPGQPILTQDNDAFPDYRSSSDSLPIVYFDSRTYVAQRNGIEDVNGYPGIRPYLSIEPPGASGYARKFENNDTFQIISPGLDGVFGTYFYRRSTSGNKHRAYYFEFPTGKMYFADPSFPLTINAKTFIERIGYATGSNGYLESTYDATNIGVTSNFHLDNLTNFAQGQLGDEVP